jgi:hypothetical protein
MGKIRSFSTFLLESESPEESPLDISQFIGSLERDSDFLRSGGSKGVVSITSIHKNGFHLKLETGEICDLLESLEGGQYYITPDFFTNRYRSSHHKPFMLVKVNINSQEDLSPGEFKIVEEYPKVSSSYYYLFSVGIHIGAKKYQDLLKAFNGAISEMSDIFSKVRVLNYERTQIPSALSEEIKKKIKEIYVNSIKDYFKTGETEPEITSLKDLIADIFLNAKNIIEKYKVQDIPDDLMSKVIQSLVDDGEKEMVKKLRSLIWLEKNKSRL